MYNNHVNSHSITVAFVHQDCAIRHCWAPDVVAIKSTHVWYPNPFYKGIQYLIQAALPNVKTAAKT